MRILLATNHLERRGGTELWIKTMYDALADDHEVSVASCTENLAFPDLRRHHPGDRYDLSIINHNTAFQALRREHLGQAIFVSHGIRFALEWPPPGADAYVAVSEDIQDFLPFRSTVIRNPIDADIFRPQSPVSQRLQRVAFLSNNNSWAMKTVERACSMLNIEFRWAGGNRRTDRPQDLMNSADLVIGLGRTALEGLACGRNVVVFDILGGDGMVRQDNIEDLRTCNLSGRLTRTIYTPERLAEEMSSYDPTRNLRAYVQQEHDPHHIADQFLRLHRQICGRPQVTALNWCLRRGPRALTTKRMTTLIDPLVREVQGRTTPDGRPGVLSAYQP